MKIELDRDNAIVIVDLEDAASLDDIREADEALITLCEEFEDLGAIYDCSRSDFSAFYSDKLLEHAQWLSSRLDKFPKRIALVAQGDLEYGICRMWEIHAENLAPRSRKVFRDMETARNWLLSYFNDRDQYQ